MNTDEKQGGLSPAESIKEKSDGLAGTIAQTYADENATHFEEADAVLLKFHGSYQQDDRDLRVERRRQKLDKAWIFMTRVKIPGGKLTCEQWLALDELADECGNATLRITSRQGIQFHGVGKANLRAVIRAVNDARLSTLGACGDVNRNVMCCPLADLDWRAPLGLQALAERIAAHFAPRSTAYYEIWCDGERWGEKLTPSREEPIYGKTYLPRKFKMAVAVPEDNSVDLYTQDVGIEAVHEGGRLLAYDLIVGGGMGYTHGKEETYPRLGSRLWRVAPDQIMAMLEAILTTQRDFGGRTDRRHARLKYLLDDRGFDWFRREVERRAGFSPEPAGPMPRYATPDYLGWHTANDGGLYVGIHFANGRVRDTEAASMRTGLREIVRRFRPGIRLTPKQNLVLTGIRPADREAVQGMLDEYRLRTDRGLPMLLRLAMACPALPTCGLALAEAERFIPQLLRELEDRGVGDMPVEIRMTGCPNSCVRTPTGEIGITGRSAGKYNLSVGGNQAGTRLGFTLAEKTDAAELTPLIERLLRAWDAQTGRRVAFGDWAVALGREALLAAAGSAA